MSANPVNRLFLSRRLPGWIFGGLLALVGGFAIYWQAAPVDIRITPNEPTGEIDPRRPLEVTVDGPGGRLADVEIKDDQGRSVAGILEEARFTTTAPLGFGTVYRVSARAVRDLSNRTASRTFAVRTVTVPKLLVSTTARLRPDGTVELAFDRPVGSLKTEGDLALGVEPDADRRTYLLRARNFPQGQTYPLRVLWASVDGIALDPFTLKLSTPEPLTARTNLHGLDRVGLGWPVQVRFSEPLQKREAALERLKVLTENGEAISGRWRWIGRRTAEFTPQPRWPAESRITFKLEPEGLLAVGGGYLEQPLAEHFSTGLDRRIAVYLDTQRAEAIENGIVVRFFPVSSGKAGTPTVTGTFYIYSRFARKTMRSSAGPGEPGHYVVENVPYAQFFHGGYAFHGTWWHNAFGRPMSHGCVNLSTGRFNSRWPNAREDAGWLWKWAALGVPVTVYAHTPAGARP